MRFDTREYENYSVDNKLPEIYCPKVWITYQFSCLTSIAKKVFYFYLLLYYVVLFVYIANIHSASKCSPFSLSIYIYLLYLLVYYLIRFFTIIYFIPLYHDAIKIIKHFLMKGKKSFIYMNVRNLESKIHDCHNYLEDILCTCEVN